ncbi:hypothetical protein Tco_0698430 [Tanacetum coccineum]
MVRRLALSLKTYYYDHGRPPDHGFVGYPFDYRVPLGFGSIAGGLDHVNPVIRLPLEHVCHEVLLGEALEASLARAQRHRQGPSSSLVITEVATSSPDDSSLATTVTPLNTIVVADYQISSLAIFDNIVSTAEPHDDLFEATILDKPMDS